MRQRNLRGSMAVLRRLFDLTGAKAGVAFSPLTMMNPPYYILFSTQPATSTSLGHPTIQYQYADDSPLSLLPQHPDEHVLLLEYDQGSSVPTVTSTSRTMAVTGVKVEEAPGAAVAEDRHNDRMYIIEATSVPGEDKFVAIC